MAAIVASVVAVVVIGAAPAEAHVCSTPVEVPVGRLSTITVGVAAEIQPVVQVAIRVPDGFRLGEARPARGWRVAVDGSTVTYTGGQIAPSQCGYFAVTGTAASKGKLLFPVTATDAAGHTTDYGEGRPGAQEVFAGVAASSDAESGSGDGGVDVALVAGVVLVAGGLAAAAVLALRRRAGRPVPPAR